MSLKTDNSACGPVFSSLLSVHTNGLRKASKGSQMQHYLRVDDSWMFSKKWNGHLVTLIQSTVHVQFTVVISLHCQSSVNKIKPHGKTSATQYFSFQFKTGTHFKSIHNAVPRLHKMPQTEKMCYTCKVGANVVTAPWKVYYKFS